MRLARALALVLVSGAAWMQLQGQTASPSAAAPDQQQPAAQKKPARQEKADQIETGKPIQANALHDERRAAKLYIQGVRQLEKQKPEAAWNLLKQAAALAPGNMTYATAAELARQSTVTQLVQQASRARAAGADETEAGQEASVLLQRALAIDPTNPLVLEHLNQFADHAASERTGTTVIAGMNSEAAAANSQNPVPGGPVELEPTLEKHSFHVRANSQQVLEQVFRAYGIAATVHESVQNRQVRLDIDDATFAEATHVLGLLTQSFYEPLDPHRVVVAKDTTENRTLFQRQLMETLYLPGLDEKGLTEVSNVAKNVFGVQQAVAEPSTATLTVRAAPKTLAAFNETMNELETGKSQIDLDVKVIQLAHINNRETGTTFFQQSSVYNLASEASSIISQNQSAVQQVIAAGLVPNANGIANQIKIILILVAAGQLTGPPFNQGLLSFGNGLTASLLSVSPATLTMSLNSSDTRVLDDIHMQLADEEDGTFKIGERYPIETSSYSSAAIPAISGISTAQLTAASQTIPQVDYQDIGLTLKATPKVMRSNDVALTLDLKMTALGGSSLNDIPILDSTQVSGVLTLQAGETAILVSDLSRTQSRALSGLPGVGDIPGLQDLSDIQKDVNVARLLILVTPSVVRDIQAAGHGPMIMLDKAAAGRPGIF